MFGKAGLRPQKSSKVHVPVHLDDYLNHNQFKQAGVS